MSAPSLQLEDRISEPGLSLNLQEHMLGGGSLKEISWDFLWVLLLKGNFVGKEEEQV